MSKPVRDRQRSGAHDAPMMTKAERRAAGKLAAQKRAAARRRKKALQNVSVALAGIGVVAVLVFIFGGFGSDGPAVESQASASVPSSAAPSAASNGVPEGLDPALKTKPVVTAGSGDVTELKVTTIVEGSGAAVQVGQTVSVNYVGVSFKDGKEFDSSWSRGQPASFPLQEGSLIEGWVKGLAGVTVGSRVQLDIPAEQAYGENPGAGQPGGDLRFVVDVLSAT